MTEGKKTTAGRSEDVGFPLNKQLLEESAKIKEERKVIKERLNKIETTKGQVSDNVYERVKTDYLSQLNENTNLLLEKSRISIESYRHSTMPRKRSEKTQKRTNMPLKSWILDKIKGELINVAPNSNESVLEVKNKEKNNE